MIRILDILIGGSACVLLLPIFVPIAVLLKFTGEGEIFFVQERVGLDAKPFGLIKFATMLKDSPNIGTGTITISNDPRILPLGHFFRKTKLNEIPQLINVILGHMSLIGPRPQTRRCFNAFPEHYQELVVKTKPGLSGIGSIVFRDEEELMRNSDDPEYLYDEVIMPYKGQLEAWYVEHSSLACYFKCIALTCGVLIYPNLRWVWRTFPQLPEPPDALRRRLLGAEREQ